MGRMQIVLCILYKALKVFGVFGPQFLEGGRGTGEANALEYVAK